MYKHTLLLFYWVGFVWAGYIDTWLKFIQIEGLGMEEILFLLSR